MRKTKVLSTLLVATCVMAFSAQAASALSITGATPFSGQHVSPQQSFNIGSAMRFTCTNVAVTNGALVANTLGTPSTNVSRFSIAYSGCTATIAGITTPAPVSTACGPWDAAPSTISGAPGSGTGRVRVCATISIPGFFGCVITVPYQTISPGAIYQNVSGAGVNVVLNIAGGASGIDWSQNGGCPGLPASASVGTFAGYQGTIRANGLAVTP